MNTKIDSYKTLGFVKECVDQGLSEEATVLAFVKSQLNEITADPEFTAGFNATMQKHASPELQKVIANKPQAVESIILNKIADHYNSMYKSAATDSPFSGIGEWWSSLSPEMQQGIIGGGVGALGGGLFGGAGVAIGGGLLGLGGGMLLPMFFEMFKNQGDDDQTAAAKAQEATQAIETQKQQVPQQAAPTTQQAVGTSNPFLYEQPFDRNPLYEDYSAAPQQDATALNNQSAPLSQVSGPSSIPDSSQPVVPALNQDTNSLEAFSNQNPWGNIASAAPAILPGGTGIPNALGNVATNLLGRNLNNNPLSNFNL